MPCDATTVIKNAVANGGFSGSDRQTLLELAGALSQNANNLTAQQALQNGKMLQNLTDRMLDQALLQVLCDQATAIKPQPGVSTLLSGLVAYWKLEEATGNRLDFTGNGNDLTTGIGNPGRATGVPNLGFALSVNGATGRGRANPSALHFANKAFSIAAWVYMTALPPNGARNLSHVAGIWRPTLTQCSYRLVIQYSSIFGATPMWWGSPDGTENVFGIGLTDITVGTWHLMVGRWQPSFNIFDLSVDNSPFGSAGGSSQVADFNSEFMLGITFDTLDPLNGRVDGVGVWNRVLSVTEVTTLWNGGAGLEYPWT